MDISKKLAKFVYETKFEDIPREVVDVEKKSILDNIGIISGGADGDGCREFVEYAIEFAASGKEEATVLGYDIKLPAIWAAFANASMTMALDFSDTSATATIHPNTSTFAVSLALSEKLGNVSGKDFLTAMIVGSEVACRLARAAVSSRFSAKGFYMPPIFTSFGATAAAAKLLGLTEEEIINAWSINLSSYTCSSELTQNKQSSIRSIREAFGAQSALSAAVLAGKGIKGFKDPFEGKQGFYTAYFDNDYDPVPVLEGLGTDYEAAKLIFKPWPCCMGNHGCINAALNILKENQINLDDIESILAEVPTVAMAVCEPLEDKKHPQNAINGKYSIPFTVSSALVHGNVTLDSFSDERLKEEKVLRLAEKFSYKLNDEWDKNLEYKTGGKITITTRDGKTYENWVIKTLGNPENPMSADQFKDKFVSCMGKASHPRDEKKANEIFAHVMDLDLINNMSDFAKML